MKDKKMFAQYMTGLSEIFDKEISKALQRIYWQVLEPFTDSDCRKAFEKSMRTAKFFPKPADLIDVLQGPESDRATEAWLKVDYAVRHVGHWESVKFDDPVIHSAIEAMGGWEDLCAVENREMVWKRKEFENLYAITSKRQTHPEYLVGMSDRQNLAAGFNDFVAEPKQIGDHVATAKRIEAPKEGPKLERVK